MSTIKIFKLLTALFLFNSIYGQYGCDIWIVGNRSIVNGEVGETRLFDVVTGESDSLFTLPISETLSTLVFDNKILFITNGCQIVDGLGNVILSNINDGQIAQEVCEEFGYISQHSTFFLPTSVENDFLVFHSKLNYDDKENLIFDSHHYSHFQYDTITNQSVSLFSDEVIIEENNYTSSIAFQDPFNSYNWWILYLDYTNSKIDIYYTSENQIAFSHSYNFSTSIKLDTCASTIPSLRGADIEGLFLIASSKSLHLMNFNSCNGSISESGYFTVSVSEPINDALYVDSNTVIISYDKSIVRLTTGDGLCTFDTIVMIEERWGTEFDKLFHQGDSIFVIPPFSDTSYHLLLYDGIDYEFHLRGINLKTISGKTLQYCPNYNSQIKCDTVTSSNISATKNAFTVYPNPANDFIIVEIENAVYSGSTIVYSIEDILGYSHFRLSANSSQFIINTEQFPSGLYILTLYANDILFSKKIIVE